jgi:hypothetical protein
MDVELTVAGAASASSESNPTAATPAVTKTVAVPALAKFRQDSYLRGFAVQAQLPREMIVVHNQSEWAVH